MVQAKSSAMCTAALSQAKEAAYKEVEQCYINDLKSFNSSPNSKQRHPPSLCTITTCYKGLISHSTLNRHINGKWTVQEFADAQTRVTQEEADEILKWRSWEGVSFYSQIPEGDGREKSQCMPHVKQYSVCSPQQELGSHFCMSPCRSSNNILELDSEQHSSTLFKSTNQARLGWPCWSCTCWQLQWWSLHFTWEHCWF